MSTVRKYVALLLAASLSGCASMLQPGLQERDRYVVNTPEYPDNRVFYLGTLDSVKYQTPLLNQIAAMSQRNDLDPKHGDPLSIVLNSASLPVKVDKGKSVPFFGPSKTRDIAVILDISADNQGGSQSIVAWYQRGVHPGQTLNFSNLLVFHQDSWDESVPPLIRIRVLDVAAESNLETREALSEVSKYGSSIALALQNPALSPIVDTAAKAASLIMANRENKMILDYSVQFYKSDAVRNAGMSIVTPLKTGRFVLLGRSKDQLKNRDYWRSGFTYDELNSDVLDTGKKAAIDSPIVLVTVNKDSVVVPQLVAAKSSYLTRLLTDATSRNLDLIKEESDDLHARVDVYVLKEKVRRYRAKKNIGDLLDYLRNNNEKVPEDAVNSVVRMLSEISSCPNLSADDLDTWWRENAKRANFKPKQFELENVDCDVVVSDDVASEGIDDDFAQE